MAGIPAQRIDMRHGFMKSIIKNQVDRDNYDKEVKAKKGSSKTNKNSKTKKPEVNIYIPPMRQRKDEREELFCLEFEDKDGQVYSFTAYKCDRAGSLARKIAHEAQLPPPFISALEERIQEEFDKRHTTQNDPVS